MILFYAREKVMSLCFLTGTLQTEQLGELKMENSTGAVQLV
jgi:hypothetical protein